MKTKGLEKEEYSVKVRVLNEVFTFGTMYYLLFNDNKEIMKLKKVFKYLTVDKLNHPGMLYSGLDEPVYYDGKKVSSCVLYETLSNKEVEEMEKWCKNVFYKTSPLLKNEEIKSINVFKDNMNETFNVQFLLTT